MMRLAELVVEIVELSRTLPPKLVSGPGELRVNDAEKFIRRAV
jgi:hypothetical protein